MSTTPTSTSYAVHGPVAVVTLNNPPVNGLGHALRSGIVAALDQALADPQVQAIVLTGSARAFSCRGWPAATTSVRGRRLSAARSSSGGR